MIKLKPGNRVGGFDIIARSKVGEYAAHLIQAHHEASGLEVAHIANNDPENLFAFIFRTPVDNDTGVPHILEHSTLCGSRQFPLKDPFVILLKGSMQTFLNAFTGQDTTVYLASSTVEEDFFNLMLVYGDAVFFPLLKQEVFLQEGFHYELDSAGKPRLQGVVYNEMQGNYSSSDSLVYDWSVRSLFPDNTYGHDCGGNPLHIPELSYQQFLEFHRRYYHPANCRLFLYGDIPLEKQLTFLEEKFLRGFSRICPDSSIQDQSPWLEPRYIKKSYPVKAGMDIRNRSSITLNWLTATIADPFEVLKLELLSEILLGNAGSVLRKTLVESRLGEDLSPASGLDTGLKQLVFSVGLRGCEPEHQEEVAECILNCLKNIIHTGVGREIVDAAVHRIEFRKRELASGSPYGFKLLFKIMPAWVHDFPPTHSLGFYGLLRRLKRYLAGNQSFYKELITKYLIDNPHRSTLLVYPDSSQTEKDARRLQDSLAVLAADSTRMEEIREAQVKLENFQKAEDPPEEVAKIPCLILSDLPRKVSFIPFREIKLGESSTLLYHDILTHNIVYMDFAFPLGDIEDTHLDYLPLFGKVILGCGLPGLGYAEVSNLISLHTGGISANVSADTTLAGDKKLYLVFNLKFLKEKFDPALKLFFNLLMQADFSNHQRIKHLIVEQRNKYKASLIPSGNYYTTLRAASRLSECLGIEERWHGVSQYQFLEKFSAELDDRLESCLKIFAAFRENVISRDNMLVNISCQASDFRRIRRSLLHLIAVNLPPGSGTPAVFAADRTLTSGAAVESLLTSSSINFVAYAFPGARIGSEENAIEAVLSHLLTTGFLWDKVRLQGGAYGVTASSYSQQGVYTFSSFRDPQLNATLKAYHESLVRITDGSLTYQELKLAIIGTIGKHEKPLRGPRRGYINFKRRLCGITDEVRQRQRDVILNLDCERIRRYVGKLLDSYPAGSTVLLTARKALEEAQKANPSLPGTITELGV